MALLLAASVLLSGCGQSYPPLPHALAALRAGDYDDFQTAKQDSDAEIKGAIQPGDDLCLASGADFFKYGVQYALGRLDEKTLFQLPEEERLLFALKVAAHDPQIPPDHFLQQAPIQQALGKGEKLPDRCKAGMANALLRDSGYIGRTNESRFEVLKGWIADLQGRYGDKLDARMDKAVAHLDGLGYSAKWPSPVE